MQVRRYSQDCYAYGLVAAGHVDIVVEARQASWDFLAQVPIVILHGFANELLYQTLKDCYLNYLEWRCAIRNLDVTIVGGRGPQSATFLKDLGASQGATRKASS